MGNLLDRQPDGPPAAGPPETCRIRLVVNGEARQLAVAPWTTLLDALREHLGMAGISNGCHDGQCGACTILVDGKRIRELPITPETLL